MSVHRSAVDSTPVERIGVPRCRHKSCVIHPEPPPDQNDDEAAEVVELLAGEGPIDHPGAVEDEADESSSASDTEPPSPM